MGESKSKRLKADEMPMSCSGLQTAGGRVQVRWEADSAATPMGQLAHFVEFLTLSVLWSAWQQRCPLSYTGRMGNVVHYMIPNFPFGRLSVLCDPFSEATPASLRRACDF